jgi:two-component system phosphate regulon sensor histidine kinase PhoR
MLSKYKLFLLIFFPAAIILLIGLAIVQENNANISKDQFEELLTNQWFMVSMIYENPGYEELFKEITKKTDLRITIVLKSGEVAFDSEAEGELEDHRNREEIRNAFQGYPTLTTRLSRTTGKSTFYFAQQLSPDSVLRVAYPTEYFDNKKTELIKDVLSGIFVLIILLFIFATIITSNTGRTLKELGDAVEIAKCGGDDFRSFNNHTLDSALYSLCTTSRRLFEVNRERAVLNKRLEYILENIEEGAILFEGEKVLYKNQSASQILGFELPLTLRDLNDPDEITVAERLIAKYPPKELKIGDKIVSVSRAESTENMLVILHDITDFQKYNLYKSILVGNISHELKTPLSIIMTASETVMGDLQMPDEIRTKFLRNIYRNSRRVNILIDDLIKLHTLENGDDTEIAESNLDDIIEDIMDIVDPGKKNIQYRFDHGDVCIHSAHIISIVTNLISNAVKYSKGDDIKVDLKKDDQSLIVSVSDGGPAIPFSERDRIFERFYSMSKSRNRESGGSGLGLSIVKHIARIYKGEARVLLNEDGGNTFSVKLLQKKGSSE